jgi:hypothetical protein
MVGFSFENLNMSLTEPGRGCKITSYVSFIQKIHYKLFTHKTQVVLYYCKVKLCLYHIVDQISRWCSLTSYFINLYMSFFYQCASPNKSNRPTRNPYKPTRDKNWNLKWSVTNILHSQFFSGEPFWAWIRPNRCSTYDKLS